MPTKYRMQILNIENITGLNIQYAVAMYKTWLHIMFYRDNFTELYLYLFTSFLYPNPWLITYNHMIPSYFMLTNATIYYTKWYTWTLFLYCSNTQHCIIVFLYSPVQSHTSVLTVPRSLYQRITPSFSRSVGLLRQICLRHHVVYVVVYTFNVLRPRSFV